MEQDSGENEYYQLDTYSLPSELKLEVSGMALLPDGRVAFAIRKGEIWVLEDVENLITPSFRLFAKGLHEPLGLAFHDGNLYTVQRTELTRLVDVNRDGLADEYQTVAKGWGVTGNYHEYAYGPVFDPEGQAWLTLNCSIGAGTHPKDNLWRGWSMRVDRDGGLHPVSGGLRSPSGLGVNMQGDVFATDQQGNWFPTCCLIQLQPGVFHGHADALQFTTLPESTFHLNEPLPRDLSVVEAAERVEPYRLPAVWFPYRKMGMSATDILCDTTKGAFGPFSGQFFVGEFTQSFVSRVFLEKVNGEYQGACFRFRSGLQSATLRLEWTATGAMLVGQSNRGWNSLGGRSYGLQRLKATGRIPFEMQTMEARPKGFRIRLTQAVDPKSLRMNQGLKVTSYTYPYHPAYGGEEIEKKILEIASFELSTDRRMIEIQLDGLRAGYVHELDASGLRSESGLELLHPQAYYTLNEIPSE